MTCRRGCYCEPHIGTGTQLEGFLVIVARRVLGPPLKLAQDRQPANTQPPIPYISWKILAQQSPLIGR